MTTVLVPPPPRISLVDERGNITRPWSLYLQDVFSRIGGNVSLSPAELQAEIDLVDERASAGALGIFGRQVQPLQEPADVRYLDVFLPKHVPMVPSPDDANNVICNRVFGKH